MRLMAMIESQNCKVYSAWDPTYGFHYEVDHPDGMSRCPSLEEAEKAVGKVEDKIRAALGDPFSLKGEVFQVEKELEG